MRHRHATQGRTPRRPSPNALDVAFPIDQSRYESAFDVRDSCDSHFMLRRGHALITLNQWARANPWKWSAAVGVVMFFIGWLGSSLWTSRLGLLGGAIWGGGFFILTAVQTCPGPGRRFANWRRPKSV
jgi:hypothetical protein